MATSDGAGRSPPEELRGPLRTTAARSKAPRTNSEFFMDAILAILVFLVVIGGLNYFEFGRLD